MMLMQLDGLNLGDCVTHLKPCMTTSLEGSCSADHLSCCSPQSGKAHHQPNPQVLLMEGGEAHQAR